MNDEEINQLVRLLKFFGYLSDVTLGDWDSYLINLELNTYSKLFNCKYYPFPRINKDTFHKYLKNLVKIVVLTTIQQSQYSTPVFIIPSKERTVRFITYYSKFNQQLVRKSYPLPRIGNTLQQLK